jgi:hypothetical protein
MASKLVPNIGEDLYLRIYKGRQYNRHMTKPHSFLFPSWWPLFTQLMFIHSHLVFRTPSDISMLKAKYSSQARAHYT